LHGFTIRIPIDSYLNVYDDFNFYLKASAEVPKTLTPISSLTYTSEAHQYGKFGI